MINIRKANEQDIDYVLNTYPRVRPVLCTGNNAYTLITLDNDNIIALVSVFKREIPAPLSGQTEDFINVIEVFDATYKNKGIGSALVDEVKKTALETGSMQIRAYCDINNIESHALWAKNNFGISPVKNENGSILGSFVTYRL